MNSRGLPVLQIVFMVSDNILVDFLFVRFERTKETPSVKMNINIILKSSFAK